EGSIGGRRRVHRRRARDRQGIGADVEGVGGGGIAADGQRSEGGVGAEGQAVSAGGVAAEEQDAGAVPGDADVNGLISAARVVDQTAGEGETVLPDGVRSGAAGEGESAERQRREIVV